MEILVVIFILGIVGTISTAIRRRRMRRQLRKANEEIRLNQRRMIAAEIFKQDMLRGELDHMIPPEFFDWPEQKKLRFTKAIIETLAESPRVYAIAKDLGY